jgi:hypothetical protein
MKHYVYAAAGFVCLNLGYVTDGKAVSIVQCETESCLPGAHMRWECMEHFPKSYDKCLAYQRKKGQTPPILEQTDTEE